MFVLDQKTTYTWPVTVEFPIDGGKTDRQTFDAEFKRVSQTRMNEIRDAIETGKTSDVDLARDVMIGWAGVTDGRGENVPFSEGSRDQLLDVPLVAAAVVYAWLSSLTGAKRKN
jgi:hypothetical protein